MTGSWSADHARRPVEMRLIARLVQLSRLVEDGLAAELDVNRTDLAAVGHLSAEPELTGRELADRLHVSTAAATHVVDRLERAGHVIRRAHASDRRKSLVELVPASRQRATDHLDPLLDGMEAAVDRLPDGDRAAVARFLTEIVGLYDAFVGPRSNDDGG